jgi:beta-N-acetylhexosaminidase
MISSQLMIAFAGQRLPAQVAADIRARGFAGVTLFYAHNVESAEQVRALTDDIQAAAPARAGAGPLLIATDQEGGQLIALRDFTTPFAGPMALGATGSIELAERVARATAIELRALGVNVNYAPVCDLATNPANPALGIRSFGEDAQAVAELVAATVRGLQAEGVAATLKHFPGAGDMAVDTHHALATLSSSPMELAERELIPFRAGIEAGAHLVMAGHFALPELTEDPALPASLSMEVIGGLLREELGFDGLTITDALDMRAVAQGAAQVVDAITALRAGEDLLLGTADAELIQRLEEGLEQAELRRLIDPVAGDASANRLARVREWLAGFETQPSLEVVGSSEHRALAAELAQRSITLVRNEDGLLPLRLDADARVAVIQSRPTNLTPADTTALVEPRLAEAIRRRHSATEGFLVDHVPTQADLAALAGRLAGFDLIVLGTAAANLVEAQAALARVVFEVGRPTVTVALRTPWDLCAYPAAGTHVCSYGILPPTMDALAGALFGETSFAGRLPVELTGLYPRGHGLTA